MFCKYCGTQIPDNSAVCSSCGKQLNAPPPTQPAATPPPRTFSTPAGSGVQAANSVPVSKIIRISLIAVLLVFFLPFMTVSCSQTETKSLSETYSGIELATTIGSSNDELLKESKKSAKPNYIVLVSLICGIAAAALVFTKNDYKKAAVLSAAGAAALVIARLTFRMYYGLNGEYKELIDVDMRFGMIFAIALFLVNAVLCNTEAAGAKAPPAVPRPGSFSSPPTA